MIFWGTKKGISFFSHSPLHLFNTGKFSTCIIRVWLAAGGRCRHQHFWSLASICIDFYPFSFFQNFVRHKLSESVTYHLFKGKIKEQSAKHEPAVVAVSEHSFLKNKPVVSVLITHPHTHAHTAIIDTSERSLWHFLCASHFPSEARWNSQTCQSVSQSVRLHLWSPACSSQDERPPVDLRAGISVHGRGGDTQHLDRWDKPLRKVHRYILMQTKRCLWLVRLSHLFLFTCSHPVFV